MAKYTSVLSQLLRYVPRREFLAIVQRQQGEKGVRSFSSWRQFVALFYGQLTGQHSLRDLVTALNSSLHKLQHVGLRAVRRSTLADANSNVLTRSSGNCFSLCMGAVASRHRAMVFNSDINSTAWTLQSLTCA